MTKITKKKRLGETLVDSGLVSEDQLNLALAEQRRTGGFLGDILNDLGFVTAGEISKLLADESSTEYIDLEHILIDVATLSLIPFEFAKANNVLAIEHSDTYLKVALADTFDVVTIDKLEKLTKLHIQVVAATKQAIEEAITQQYTQATEIKGLIDEAVKALSHQDDEVEAGQEAALVRLVDQIIIDGNRKRATDIHIEPEKTSIRIRYRIDGILYQECLLPISLKASVEARLKVMASMDVTEHRIPQDGRIEFQIGQKRIDIRVSTLPTQYGQSVVMRIFDKQMTILDLNKLGLRGNDFERFKKIIDKPNGIILVTGPTGSGKTTTLYAALSAMNSTDHSIFTLEDPIEYDLSNIRQVQVKPDVGLSFSEGLRSLLRQDPDKILVGEIRDEETAQLAVRASLTGHLVLSTLHTNSAVGAIPRLINMGIEPYLLSSSLLLVVAQRLVRRLCHCAVVDEEATSVIQGLKRQAPEGAIFKKANGCKDCGQIGYKGRVAVYELLEVTEELQHILKPGITETEIVDKCLKGSQTFMVDDGILKASQGLTSLNEVKRLVG